MGILWEIFKAGWEETFKPGWETPSKPVPPPVVQPLLQPHCEPWEIPFRCKWPDCTDWVKVHIDEVRKYMTLWCPRHQKEGSRFNRVESDVGEWKAPTLREWAAMTEQQCQAVEEQAKAAQLQADIEMSGRAYRRLRDNEGDPHYWASQL